MLEAEVRKGRKAHLLLIIVHFPNTLFQIVALALKSLSLILKYQLENMSAESSPLLDRLFVILSEHAGLGSAANKSVAVELTTTLFKVSLQREGVTSRLNQISKIFLVVLCVDHTHSSLANPQSEEGAAADQLRGGGHPRQS